MNDERRVFCSLRQMVSWDGRTHQEMIDRPVPLLGPRMDALEARLDLVERKLSTCNRCNDTGWLDAIEGRDGSYITSRPCKCDEGEQASRLPEVR